MLEIVTLGCGKLAFAAFFNEYGTMFYQAVNLLAYQLDPFLNFIKTL